MQNATETVTDPDTENKRSFFVVWFSTALDRMCLYVHSVLLCSIANSRRNMATGVHEHYARQKRGGICSSVHNITQQSASKRAGKKYINFISRKSDM